MKLLLLPLSVLFLFSSLPDDVTARASDFTIARQTQRCPLLKPVRFLSKSNIYYAADNEITLFINGVQKGRTVTEWHLTTHKFQKLVKGDVVAFEVKDLDFWFGMIASINFNGWSSTGLDKEWRAIRAADYVGPPGAWKKPSYNACSWPTAKTLPGTVIGSTPGTSSAYPTALGGKYVWAKGAGEKDRIYVRRVVGSCCLRQPRTNVHYAADNEVTMFVNGRQNGPTATEWHRTTSKSVALSYGDVVAFRVTDIGVWYGLAAAINVNGWSSTGSDAEWRAIAARDYKGSPGAWKLKSYDPCAWPSATTRTGTNNGVTPGTSPSFPYSKTGANYVWASGAAEWQTIYVRRVVGGVCK